MRSSSETEAAKARCLFFVGSKKIEKAVNMFRKKKIPVLAVTAGDPAGIGPEIAIRAAMDRRLRRQARMVLVGGRSVWEKTAAVLGRRLRLRPFDSGRPRPHRAGVVEFADCPETGGWQWGRVSAGGGAAAYAAVETAVRLIERGQCDAVVTAPLNKESLRAAGVPYIGHTEIFEGLTGSENPMTVFLTGKLCVFFYTRHLPLSQVPAALEAGALCRFILRCRNVLREWGIETPRIAVAGFNPHCGEHGLLGDEEMISVAPAVASAVAGGVDAVGPIGADSVFAQAAEGRYDAVVSLYHDQGHIACKTLDFHRTVSVTAGLPFLRVSVDHGTAFDIAGKGIADAAGMKEAVAAAARMVARSVRIEKKNCHLN